MLWHRKWWKANVTSFAGFDISHPITINQHPVITIMSGLSNNLHGLALSRSERVIVLGLSYAWCTPLFFWAGERVWHYLRVLRTPPQADNQQARPQPPNP